MVSERVILVLAALLVLAFAISRGTAGALAAGRFGPVVLDHPNERSLHQQPTPRTGGIAILLGIVVALAAATALGRSETFLWAMAAAAVAIGGVSFWNDRVELSPAVRLICHVAVAIGLVLSLDLVIPRLAVPLVGALDLGRLAPLVSIVFLVWLANLYNFMDGMDGFAGGMTVSGFGFLAWLAWHAGDAPIALFAAIVAAASAGFLMLNLPPARIFMGDVGSVPLGLLAGALALAGVRRGIFDVWVPVLLFSPFIVDASTALVARLVRGEKIWEAHRQHYYQRLVLAGWGHRRTVLAEYGLMIGCGLSAVAYVLAPAAARLALILAWILVYVALAAGVAAVERRRETHSG